MGVNAVWYSPGRWLRVELTSGRGGGEVLYLFEQGVAVGQFRDVTELDEVLRQRYRLVFAQFDRA